MVSFQGWALPCAYAKRARSERHSVEHHLVVGHAWLLAACLARWFGALAYVVVWFHWPIVLCKCNVGCPFVVLDCGGLVFLNGGNYVFGEIVHPAPFSRPRVGNGVASAVDFLLPRFVVVCGVVAWYPAQIGVFDTHPVHLLPYPNPYINHWTVDVKAVSFAAVERLDMVSVVRDDQDRRQRIFKSASNGLEFRSGCCLWVPAERPVQYLDDVRGLLLFLSGALFAFAGVVATVLLFTPLHASVPRVVRVGACASTSCSDLALVLLGRDEHCGYLVGLRCVFVLVNV